MLPLPDNVIRNSHFEEELVPAWQVGGDAAPTRTLQAHTGDYALLLGAWPLSPTLHQVYTDTLQEWAVSQTVALSPTIHRPILSWMYRISGTASVSDTLIVTVLGLESPLSYTIPLTGAGWQHAWLGLEGAGGIPSLTGATPVTIAFSFRRAVSDTLQVWLDEVTLGSGDDGPTHVFLPLAGKNFPRQLVFSDAYEPDDYCPEGSAYGTVRSQRHNFHVAGDENWLRFWGKQGQQYVIETFDLGPRCDTVLILRGRDGSVLLEDDNSGGGLASRIVWTAPELDIYSIGVRHKDGSIYGKGTEYSLSIRLLP